MKKTLLLLAALALLFTGCTTIRHSIVVSNDGEVNPDYYTEITPISKTEDGLCAVTDFFDLQSKRFDNVVDVRAEQISKTTSLGFLVFKDEETCEYRALGVKYKDAAKFKKSKVKAKAPKAKKKSKKKKVDDDVDEDVEDDVDEDEAYDEEE